MRTALAILAWISMLLPWQLCLAACHDRVELGAHDCHPEGACPEQPGEESKRTGDVPLSFASVDAGPPQPFVAPAPVATTVVAATVLAAPVSAPPHETPPPLPRTTALLL